MAEEDKSAEPRTTTKQSTVKKTTAKAESSTSQMPHKRTAAKKPTASTARKRTTKAKAAASQVVGEAPAPVIERTSPEQFGRVNVLDITPNVENGLFPARVELGEAFNVTAQVFIEGRTKPDGTIAFAENPPKKYQDIYPIDFNADMEGIEKEVERIMDLWVKAGVTIFRVDNPHTKPVRFWQDVIAAVTKKHPEVLFLAEAFTRPGMRRALSYVGFTQSHCYFPWRNTKEELEEYFEETNGDGGFYQHNTFWPTTPDILTAYVRDNGIAGHAVRAVLAAMGSPSWGIYNGYELIENKQRPGFEEQIDNEKYEVKVRDWNSTEKYGIAELLTSLNKIRATHPACRSYHNLHILPSDDAGVIAFLRQTPAELTGTGKADTVIVIVNLDGHNAHQSIVHVELGDFGFATDKPLKVHDELTGRDFEWGYDNYVSLAPWADVAHVLTVVED